MSPDVSQNEPNVDKNMDKSRSERARGGLAYIGWHTLTPLAPPRNVAPVHAKLGTGQRRNELLRGR